MLSANTDELEKSLAEYKAEVERKLKHMVVGFAQDVAEVASGQTRLGDVARWARLYRERAASPLRIAPEAGFHKGAWVYSEGDLTFNNKIYDVGTMLGKVDYQAEANYKIGDSFIIGAEGPAYEMLQTLDDIEGNTISTVMKASAVDLLAYYNEG